MNVTSILEIDIDKEHNRTQLVICSTVIPDVRASQRLSAGDGYMFLLK